MCATHHLPVNLGLRPLQATGKAFGRRPMRWACLIVAAEVLDCLTGVAMAQPPATHDSNAVYGVPPAEVQVTAANAAPADRASASDFDWIRQLGGQASSQATPNGERWYLSLDASAVADDQLQAIGASPGVSMVSLAKTGVSDAGVRHLSGMRELNSLNLFSTKVTDAGMDAIASLDALQRLALHHTAISDTGVARFAALLELRALAMDETKVSDAGMIVLAALPRLQELSIRATQVSDVGLLILGQSASIEQVWVTKSQVSPEGVRMLRMLRPELRIIE